MTYRETYLEGVRSLDEAGIAENEITARLLLEYVCNTDANTLYAHPDREVTKKEQEDYNACINKRREHIPLQHILGYQEFMGLKFTVSRDTLIPRQDTEFLVEEALIYIEDGMSVLDMCTGSGCILLSVMNYKNDIDGVGCDISKEALNTARVNAKKLNLDAQFYEGDLFDALPGTKEEALPDDKEEALPETKDKKLFDVIISNPPYIPAGVINTLSEEVRDYDPHMALDGGDDGLYYYRRIAAEAKNHLKPYGRLYLEIGHDQNESVPKILKDEGYDDITVLKDYGGNWRVAYCRGNANSAPDT